MENEEIYDLATGIGYAHLQLWRTKQDRLEKKR